METEDDEYLSLRARKFVLGASIMRDACVSRLEINYKHDLMSVKMYERFYSKIGVAVYYIFTVINLSTILLEQPSTILIDGKDVPYYIPIILNLICESYFYYRWYMIHSMSETQSIQKNMSYRVSIVILVLMTIDAVVYIICQHVPGAKAIRWSRGLRPILLLSFPENRRLRAAFDNLRKTAFDVIPVLGIFLFTVMFSSIICLNTIGSVHLKYPDGRPYFNDFFEVFWELYLLTTTTNSPDVMIPAYEHSRFTIVIYIFICTVCNWLFMGILTACVYNSYKAHLGEFVVDTVAKRKRKLDDAYDLISTPTPDGEMGVTQDTFLRLMRLVKPRRSEDSVNVLFHILDKGRSGYLSRSEFTRLSEYLQAEISELELSRQYFQTFVPRFYNAFDAPSYVQFRNFVNHKITRLIFGCMVAANGITAVAFHRYPSLQDAVEWFFTILFLIELIMNYIASGGVRFFDDGWNIFDCVVVFGALFGQILQSILLGLGISLPSGITQMLLLLRLFRLLKVFSTIPSFRVVINCIITIIPSLTAYAAILIILFYIFAAIGMQAYAHVYSAPEDFHYNSSTSCGHTELIGSEFVGWHYCIFNFNSASEAFILLLAVTVGNNWHIFAEGYAVTTNAWTRLFFIFIHWSCVLLVLNVVLAFIIEAFLIEFDAQQSKFEIYIKERLQELGMDAETELAAKGLGDCRKRGFVMRKEELDRAFPPDSPRAKAFFLRTDTASIEILMYRMFEGEVEDLLATYRSSIRQARFRVKDTLGGALS